MDHKEFVKNFIQEINSQDNRCTAFPYFYQIEDEIQEPTSEDYANDYCWYYDCETYTEDQVLDYLAEEYIDNEYDEFDDFFEDNGFRKIYLKTVKRYSGLFLTESDAEIHLKLNRYHYNENARTYVRHAWRSPQFEQFMKSVAVLVGLRFGESNATP